MNWMPVIHLPPVGERVLATDGETIEIMIYQGEFKKHPQWTTHSYNMIEVKHWMILPDLPSAAE